MADIIQIVNSVTALFCGTLISMLILDKRVHEGPFIKFGMILMTFGLFATGIIIIKDFDTLTGIWNATLLMRLGLTIILIGYFWKLHVRNN